MFCFVAANVIFHALHRSLERQFLSPMQDLRRPHPLNHIMEDVAGAVTTDIDLSKKAVLFYPRVRRFLGRRIQSLAVSYNELGPNSLHTRQLTTARMPSAV